MQKQCLGQTGIEVSRVGLGTVKFGRNTGVKYPENFALPSDQEVMHLLSLAGELGITLLDTAPAYGVSEERLGKLLGNARREFVISTKVGETFVDNQSCFDYSKNAVRLSIERSLKRLRTDYLDIILIHSNGESELAIQEMVFPVLADCKKAGMIRAYGMSTKTVEGGMQAVEESDVVMVAYHADYVAERSVIQYAHQKQKGVLIKKAFNSGHAALGGSQHIQSAMQFVFAEPGVTSVVLGTINPVHLRENVAAAVGCFPLLAPQ
ncbi:MAG TPA: aldo/keto reductase [Gammaproteobacteria bacterium]|nr:aldo/keto reductase [Gammaproteobacteria bacterium]